MHIILSVSILQRNKSNRIYLDLYLYAATAKLLQSCPTLCNPIDGSPPGSPIPGILQARTLEWVAISFSNAGKWKVKGKLLSRVRLLATPWTAAHQAPLSMGFLGKSAGVGCHHLLHCIFIKIHNYFCLFSYLSIYKEIGFKKLEPSLVVHWLRICLPVQWTQVLAQVREDSTCCGAAKPVHHNKRSPHSRACAWNREATTVRNPCTTTGEWPPLAATETQLSQI